MAHLLRVSTVGAMASSLGHELNQPLTAILANAQAAQKLLQEPEPDLGEVREILRTVILGVNERHGAAKRSVEVFVRDTGRGLRPGSEE